MLVSGDDMEVGSATSIAWGNDPANSLSTEMSELYVGSQGGGPLQAALTW